MHKEEIECAPVLRRSNRFEMLFYLSKRFGKARIEAATGASCFVYGLLRRMVEV